MKEFFKMFFASLLAIVVTGFFSFVLLIIIIAGIAKSVSNKESAHISGNVLKIDISNKIHEQGQSNSFAAFNNGSPYSPGFFDIAKAITAAKNDAKIKGIFLQLGSTPNGWATLQQLRFALEEFKSSGKFIYAYGENIPQNSYYVASAADSIYLNPAGRIELKGFATMLAFFKGTLDKLELQPEIFFAGKFKSATEPFRADKMSDPNRLQIEAFQKSLWEQFITAAARYMHTEKDVVTKLAVNGSIQFPQDALKNKMVAGLLYWDEVEKRIRKKTGQSGNSTLKFINIEDYAFQKKSEVKFNENKIALLFAEGQIVDGETSEEQEIASKTYAEQIRKIANDDKIKAVVLRINSPGGSALASEVILRELELLKKKKPLIVSMGDYAASGGYYIACKADSIFALPNTITGSIGVFSMLFNANRMMRDKLGVTFDEVKNAPYADMPNIFRPLTVEEAKRMQASVDTVYSMFKNHVATGRKMNVSKVDEIAQGRIWTGTDALKIGLVDGLGGLGRAFKSAAAKAKLSDYKVVTYPEPVDKFNAMIKKIKSNTSMETAVKKAVVEETGFEMEWLNKLKSLKRMNGQAQADLPFVLQVN